MKTILVAEDDPAVLSIVTLIIQKAGYTCIQALNGIDASEIFEKLDSVDALVSDIRMPGMNGFELALFVRNRKPSLPILLMSGYAGTAKKESLDLFAQPNIHFLSKPFTPAQITMYLQRMLTASN
jgi:CheY-like chemotaxis protein